MQSAQAKGGAGRHTNASLQCQGQAADEPGGHTGASDVAAGSAHRIHTHVVHSFCGCRPRAYWVCVHAALDPNIRSGRSCGAGYATCEQARSAAWQWSGSAPPSIPNQQARRPVSASPRGR
eukprot:6676035-Prymnesium_polylepis.1